MKSIRLEESRCPQNHHCPVIRVCPSGAISQKNPISAPEIDYTKCTSCGVCTRYCGPGAFRKA